MPTVGFEPTIPVSERPKTHALDRTASWIGSGPLYRRDKQEDVTMGIWVKRRGSLVKSSDFCIDQLCCYID
jgi:hypothetical protein